MVKHVVVPKTLPWNAADSPLPGSVWIVALFRRKVKSVAKVSTFNFCVAVDKEIRLTQHEANSATFIFE